MTSQGTRRVRSWQQYGPLKETERVSAQAAIISLKCVPGNPSPTVNEEFEEPPREAAPVANLKRQNERFPATNAELRSVFAVQPSALKNNHFR